MNKHFWVKLQYTPIIVEQKDDGTLSVSEDIESVIIAEDEALLGCWFCQTPLAVESFDTECTPQANAEI